MLHSVNYTEEGLTPYHFTAWVYGDRSVEKVAGKKQVCVQTIIGIPNYCH